MQNRLSTVKFPALQARVATKTTAKLLTGEDGVPIERKCRDRDDVQVNGEREFPVHGSQCSLTSLHALRPLMSLPSSTALFRKDSHLTCTMVHELEVATSVDAVLREMFDADDDGVFTKTAAWGSCC